MPPRSSSTRTDTGSKKAKQKTQISARAPGEPGIEVFTFEEHDGKTTLTTISKFDSIEQRDGVIASGMEKGAAEMWDRLEEHLRTMA